jgi:hypothetical protein
VRSSLDSGRATARQSTANGVSKSYTSLTRHSCWPSRAPLAVAALPPAAAISNCAHVLSALASLLDVNNAALQQKIVKHLFTPECVCCMAELVIVADNHWTEMGSGESIGMYELNETCV